MKKEYILPIIIWATMILVFVVKCGKKPEENDGFVTKMLDYKYIPVVEVTLNKQKAYMLLDTGASLSIFDKNQIKKYNIVDTGIEPDAAAVGYGGADFTYTEAFNVNLYLGQEKMTDEFKVKDIGTIVDVVRKQTGYKIVGILGNNNIAKSNLILNFKNGSITNK